MRFYNPETQKELEHDPLAWLDQEAGYMIRGGYVIDHLITNPAIRSFWKKFWPQILYRARETDRQTRQQTITLETHNTDGESGSRGSEDAGPRKPRALAPKAKQQVMQIVKATIARQTENKMRGFNVEQNVVHNSAIADADVVPILGSIPEEPATMNALGTESSRRVSRCGASWG